MLTTFLFSGKKKKKNNNNIVFTDPNDRHIKHNLLPRELKRRGYCSVRPKEEHPDG